MLKTCGHAGTLRVRILCYPAQMVKNDDRQVTNSGHAVILRVRTLIHVDTQGQCVSALWSIVRTRNDTACPHELRADRQRSCVSAQLTQCGHAMTLRVRMYQCADTQDHCVSALQSPVLRTSSNPACPLSLYADKQRSCVSALYCSQSHVHLCSVRPFM